MIKFLIIVFFGVFCAQAASEPLTRFQMCYEICKSWLTFPPYNDRLTPDELDTYCQVFSASLEDTSDEDVQMLYTLASSPINTFVLRPAQLSEDQVSLFLKLASERWGTPIEKNLALEWLSKSQGHLKAVIQNHFPDCEEDYQVEIYHQFLNVMLENFKHGNPGVYEKFFAMQDLLKTQIMSVEVKIRELFNQE